MISFFIVIAIICLMFIYVNWFEELVRKHSEYINSKGFYYEFFIHVIKIVVGLALLHYVNFIGHLVDLKTFIMTLWG